MSSTASATRSDRVPTHARSWPLATAAVGTIALAATTAALGARLLAVWPDLVAAGRQWTTPSTLAVDTLVAAPLLAAGAALAAWWALSLLLITVSLIADRAGVHSVALLRCIHALAPRALRRLAVAGVGAGLTLSALPAHAAEEPPDLGWTTARSAATAQPDLRTPDPSAQPGLTVPADASVRTDPSADLDPVDPTSLGAPVPREAVVAPTPAPAPAPDQAVTERSTGAQSPASAQPSGPQPSAAPTPSPGGAAPAVPAPTAQPPSAPSAAQSPAAPLPTTPSRSAPSDSAPPPAAPSPAGDLRPDLEPGVVVVAPDDTLWDLAAAALPPGASNADVATSWHAWYALNVAVIGADPDLLHPGQILQVPRAA